MIHARNILVIGASWVGDTVLSLPTIRGLRRLFSEAHIGLLTRGYLGEMLREIVDIDEVISYQPRKGFYRWADDLARWSLCADGGSMWRSSSPDHFARHS